MSKLGQRTQILSGYGSTCPTCNAPATDRCRCQLGDTKCANGHWYHECAVHGLVSCGARHGLPKEWCTCDDSPIEPSK